MKIFSRMLSPLTSKAYAQGVAEGRQMGRVERDKTNTESLASKIGHPVIVIPNEWTNPVIGFGHSIMTIGTSEVLVVKDYLTMEERFGGGVRLDFSEQRLEVVLSLDPYQLWAITAHNTVRHEDFDKPRTGERWSRERILSELHNNGFFEQWRQYKSTASSPHEQP